MRIFASNLLPLFSQLLNDLRGLAPAPIHLYSVGNHFEHFGINAPLVLARILPKLRIVFRGNVPQRQVGHTSLRYQNDNMAASVSKHGVCVLMAWTSGCSG